MRERSCMFPDRCKNTSGFTLIELLIVMGMLSVVTMAVIGLYTSHQKSSYSEEEVADVQQNLRIAMDSITRDIRMAGCLIPADNDGFTNLAGNITVAIQNVQNDTALGNSDRIWLNVASPNHVFATLSQKTTGPGNMFVDNAESVDSFQKDDLIRIIRISSKRLQPDFPPNVGGASFQVTKTSRTGPWLLIAYSAGPATSAVAAAAVFDRGDVIINTGAVYPNTISYYLVNNATAAACPVFSTPGVFCLAREVNTPPAGAGPQVIATNITNLQFTYLLESHIEVNNPLNVAPPLIPDLQPVSSVRVTITGQTSETAQLTQLETGSTTPRQRSITSVIKLRNGSFY